MPKRVLNGIVCSSSNNKTIVVKVERLLKHPIYKKYVKKTKKYYAHDSLNKCNNNNLDDVLYKNIFNMIK